MKKNQYDRVVAKMSEFIEPGEQVTEAFSGRGSHPYTAWLMAIPPFMVIFNKPRIVVATDRNLYVMRGMGTPGELIAKYSRATTNVETGVKRFFMLQVKIGPTTVWAPIAEGNAAREFAAKMGDLGGSPRPT